MGWSWVDWCFTCIACLGVGLCGGWSLARSLAEKEILAAHELGERKGRQAGWDAALHEVAVRRKP